MTWLDWLGAIGLALPVVALLTWAANEIYEAWPRESDLGVRREPLSPTQLFLEGGGDLSNPRVAALLEEAERGWNRNHGTDSDA